MSYTLFAIELALYYTLGWVGGHWPWDWEPEKKNVGEYYRSIPPHVTTGESLIVDSWRSYRHLRTPLHIYTLHSHNFFRLKQVNKISYTESEDHLNLSLIIQLLTQLGIVYSHPTSLDFSAFHPSYWQCRLLSNCCIYRGMAEVTLTEPEYVWKEEDREWAARHNDTHQDERNTRQQLTSLHNLILLWFMLAWCTVSWVLACLPHNYTCIILLHGARNLIYSMVVENNINTNF